MRSQVKIITEPLASPQMLHSRLRVGKAFRLDTDVRITPLGLLAIGALVCGIPLSVPPIIRAAGAASDG